MCLYLSFAATQPSSADISQGSHPKRKRYRRITATSPPTNIDNNFNKRRRFIQGMTINYN